MCCSFSFQSWFDFSAVHEADNEKLLAQEQEAKVLQTLHSVGGRYC